MYLQFNWPCWNFENEKWDILEKRKKLTTYEYHIKNELEKV